MSSLEDLEYREAYQLGRYASENNHPKSANPFWYQRWTPSIKKRYAAWKRGWLEVTYRRVIDASNNAKIEDVTDD